MTFTAAENIAKSYCNCLAQERGLNPAGHAGDFDDALIIEVPLPWKYGMMQQAGALPQLVIDLLATWLEAYRAGQGYRHRPLAVAPDSEYSRVGYRRVMFYSRQPGLIAQFDKIEYLVPVDEVGSLAWALYQDRASLPRFEQYRVPKGDQIRDILVCTHGTIDAACARFGYPLYKHMRDMYADEGLRVWRVSHFGGHVFAPTLMDMPSGHYWAYIGNSQAEQIIHRNGDVADLQDYYRGWAGVPRGFAQAAECALWQEHGWRWLTYARCAEVLAQDGDQSQWAEVRITYASPDGHAQGTADFRVDVQNTIETEPSTGKPHLHAYPQYRVIAHKLHEWERNA